MRIKYDFVILSWFSFFRICHGGGGLQPFLASSRINNARKVKNHCIKPMKKVQMNIGMRTLPFRVTAFFLSEVSCAVSYLRYFCLSLERGCQRKREGRGTTRTLVIQRLHYGLSRLWFRLQRTYSAYQSSNLIFCWYPTELKNPIISVLTALAFKDESIRTEYVVKMNVDMSQGMADVSLS
jgi:hypothetical protein